MGKQGVILLLLGVALGANLVLGTWVVVTTVNPQPVLGGTVDGATEGYTVATGRLQGKGEADCLYVWSHADKKMAIYFMNSKHLELLAVRDCQYDFRAPQFSSKGGQQRPTIQEMRDMLRK